MNNIYVLDQDFKLQGVIDEYVSSIWRPSYSEVGDFEIYLGATDKAIDLLRENRYVVRSSDISTSGVVGGDNATVQTPNGLNGIPVSTGGNYIDEYGQQWLCDEIVRYSDGTGQYIQRIKKIVFDGVNEVCAWVNPSLATDTGNLVQMNLGASARWTDFNPAELKVLSDKATFFNFTSNATCFKYGIRRDGSSGVCVFYIGTDEGVNNVATANTWLQNNPITIYYAINPITQPLGTDQIKEIEKLLTFYPVTTITNDSNCGILIKYSVGGLDKSVSGSTINSSDLSGVTLTSFSLCGKSTQNGSPTPANPIPVTISGSKGSIVVRTVGEGDIVTYKKVMLIKNIQLITDVENGDFYCVTGKELKFLLHQRIIWKQTNLRGTAEEAIRRLVNENAITPTDSNRIIPNLTLGLPAGLTATIEKQITGEYLDKAITDICLSYNYGWDIFISNSKLVLEVYEGLDRSYGQSVRPYVVFSDKFDNLYNTDYQLSTENYANTTLVGGEGEGLERVFVTLNNDNAGLKRYETFIDARDISSNKGTAEEIDHTTYNKLLSERGRDKLASLTYTEGFSGEVLSDVAFIYGEDFFIGDLVTVINKYGIQKNVRVLSAIESEDETGKKLLPQFNI